MRRRPLGFHAGEACLTVFFDLFHLMAVRRWLFYLAPLWLPFYLMAYIWFYVVTQSLPELLRLMRLWRRVRGG